MMKVSLLLPCILISLITIAQAERSNNFTIRISIKDADKNTRLYLAYQADGRKILDSVLKKEGFFVFSGTTDRPLNATLITDYEGIGSQQLMKRGNTGGDNDALKFYIHPGVIYLKTDRLIENAVFSGSVINADNERLKALLKPVDDQRSHLSKQLRASGYVGSGSSAKQQMSAADSLMVRKWIRQLDSLAPATRPVLKKFIEENPNSYISLKSLMSIAGAFPDLQVIEPMYNRLSVSVKNTIEGKEYQKFLLDRKIW